MHISPNSLGDDNLPPSARKGGVRQDTAVVVVVVWVNVGLTFVVPTRQTRRPSSLCRQPVPLLYCSSQQMRKPPRCDSVV